MTDQSHVTVSTALDRQAADAAEARIDRWLATGLITLGTALAVNTLLGPLVANVIEYPFSETLYNQTMGLEAVSLAVVAPWSLLAALLVARRHRAGHLLAIPPAAYTVYMFLQYVLGPEYATYAPQVAFHLGIFVLGGVVLLAAWARIRSDNLPALSVRRRRRLGVAVFLLGAFILSRYLGAIAGLFTEAPIEAEFAADPTMYWSIVLLDLGVVVPITLATAAGLVVGADWALKALYGVVGWFVLVPISVAAMSLAMLLRDDPNATAASVAVLAGVSVVFVAFAAWVYRPLVGAGKAGSTTLSDGSTTAPGRPSRRP